MYTKKSKFKRYPSTMKKVGQTNAAIAYTNVVLKWLKYLWPNSLEKKVLSMAVSHAEGDRHKVINQLHALNTFHSFFLQ